MAESSSVDIYGILPPGHGETDHLIDISTEVFVPPQVNDGDSFEYRLFRAGGADFEHGTADDTESLKRAMDDWDGGIIEGGDHSLWTYEDLGFKLVLNYPVEDSPEPPSIALRIPWEHFREDSMFHDNSPEAAVEQCIDLAAAVFESFDCQYTFGVSRYEARSVAAEPTRADLDDGVTRIHWLDVLPTALVDAIGRERLLQSQAWDVREIENALILVAHSNPVDDGLLQIEALNRELGLLDE